MSERTSREDEDGIAKNEELSKNDGQNSPPSGKQGLLVAIAMLGCCGLPLILVAASSLAIVSFFTITNTLVLIGVLAALGLSVYAIRVQGKRRIKQSADCCD